MSGWRPVTSEEATRLERELARELPAKHVLRGRVVRAHARRDDRDDVAFLVEGSGLGIVHLTWNVETDAAWPAWRFVEELGDEDE